MNVAEIRSLLVAACLVIFASGSARADDAASSVPPSPLSGDAEAAAQALFVEGKRLVAEGRFAEGCEKLEQSGRIDPAPGTEINLADCYERVGRVATAWLAFHQAAALAGRMRRDEWAKQALDRAARLEAHVPRLSIVVDEPAPGLAIRRDDVLLESSTAGIPIPLDPGSYRIAAQAPGRTPWSTTVPVANGALVVLHVPPLALEAPVCREAKEPQRPMPDLPPARSGSSGGPPRGALQRSLALATGAASLVMAGVGLYFGLNAITDDNDAAARCPTAPRCSDPEAIGLTNAAHRSANVSTIVFAASGVLLVTATAVYFTAPRARAAPLAIGIAGSSAVVRGEW
jgi:hypothetical protein